MSLDTAESTVRRRTDPPQRSWRASLHRLHVIAGVFVAPLLMVATITGFFYALAPSLEKVIYQEELSAPAAASGAPARPIEEQVRVAEVARGGEHASAVEIPGDKDHSTHVLFKDPSLISKSYKHSVFVDPGDASVRGDLVQYGSSAALPFRAWLSEGHRRLWLGEPGRLYSEIAASWMGALTLGGLWLWWDRCRRQRTHGTSRRSHFLRNHAIVGSTLALGLLFLTITGLTWSSVAGNTIAQARQELSWVAPMADTTMAQPAIKNQAAPFDWAEANRVLDTARAEGLDGKITLTPPENPGEAWTAKEARQEWRTDMNTITVDGATGAVVDEVRWKDWPIMAKMAEWLINAHMGILFGWVNQLILAIIALGLGVIIVWGWTMWFLRGRHSVENRLMSRQPGRLPKPVGWSRIPWLLIGCCVLYSLIAPLFGVTLLLFLIGDAVYQRVRATKKERA